LTITGCSSISSWLFILPSSREPRALHSFPTRRSSDLMRVIAAHQTTHCGPLPAMKPMRLPLPTPDASSPRPRVEDCCSNAANVRSEEHTSELQSRGHLVCRLLLEKKNTVGYL